MYPEEIVIPMKEELTENGFSELLTPADVDAALNRKDDKIILVMLNSVCGCAAGSARPGVILSLMNAVVPHEYVSLFAGMEKEAVNYFREKYLPGLTHSSPNIALFKNDRLVHMLHRYQVERKTAGEIARELTGVYQSVCSKRNSSREIDQLKKNIENRHWFNPDL